MKLPNEEYKKAADSCMKGTKAEYVNDIKRIRDREYFPDHYKHKDISEAGASKSISGHPFYKRLQEYCRESNKEDSQQEQNEANGRLEESKKAGEEANKADDYPDPIGSPDSRCKVQEKVSLHTVCRYSGMWYTG